MPRNLYPVTDPDRSILAGETLLEEVFADARLHTAIEAWLAATPLLPAIPSRVDLRDVCEPWYSTISTCPRIATSRTGSK